MLASRGRLSLALTQSRRIILSRFAGLESNDEQMAESVEGGETITIVALAGVREC